jgi:hypothetical protein
MKQVGIRWTVPVLTELAAGASLVGPGSGRSSWSCMTQAPLAKRGLRKTDNCGRLRSSGRGMTKDSNQ